MYLIKQRQRGLCRIEEADMMNPSRAASSFASHATLFVDTLKASPPAQAPDEHDPAADDRWAIAALVVALFIAIFALRMVSDTREIVTLLFGVPIALVARRFGPSAGFVAAGVALGLVEVRAGLQEVPVPPLGLLLRAAVFLSIPIAAGTEARWGKPAPPLGPHAPSNRHASNGHPPVSRSLTKRELDVLRLIALGHTNTEVADQLVVSVRTVESHRARIHRKLGRPGRSQLVRYALQHGLVET